MYLKVIIRDLRCWGRRVTLRNANIRRLRASRVLPTERALTPVLRVIGSRAVDSVGAILVLRLQEPFLKDQTALTQIAAGLAGYGRGLILCR